MMPIKAWILVVTTGLFTIDDVPRAEATFHGEYGCVMGAQHYLREQESLYATARCWNYLTNKSVRVFKELEPVPPPPTRNPKR